MVYDNIRKVVLDDVTIEKIAKAQISGEDLPVTKEDWMTAIEERAEKLYADTGMSDAQKFSKAIGGSASLVRGYAVDAGDPLCRLYYDAMKIAPQSEPETGAVTKRTANQQISELASLHRQAFPSLSSAQAFAQVWTDRANIELKSEAVRENALALNDAERFGPMRRQLGLGQDGYQNPHVPLPGEPRPKGA